MQFPWISRFLATRFRRPEATTSEEVSDEEWISAWRAMPHRLVVDPVIPDESIAEFARWGSIAYVTICPDPPQYADRGYRKTQRCPICGESTAGSPRFSGMLHLEFVNGRSIGIVAWVHHSCFETCPAHPSPRTVPW